MKNIFGFSLYYLIPSWGRGRKSSMRRINRVSCTILVLLLLFTNTLSDVDAGEKTTANLCRGCHGDNYGAYTTLSQYSVPAEVGLGETFTVSVRMVLSGNLDQSRPDYWKIDNEVTLSSSQGRFSFSPATYTHNDKLPNDVVDISWQLTADQGVGSDTLTVSVYSVAQHFSRTGIDQLSSSIEVTPPNTPPQLSAAAFSPIQGDVNQLFGFEVIWTDADGDLPSYLRLIVDGNSLPLSEANSGSDDPITGVRFISSSMTLPAGHHTYFFQGSDGEAGVRLPAGDEVTQGPQGPLTGVYPGPFVGLPPTLQNDTLTPSVGDGQTNFTYSIQLDGVGGLNGTTVRFWLDGIDSGIQPVVTDLGNAGWQFNFSTTLAAGVSHFHHFTASNEFGSVRFPAGSESLSGPIIVGDVLSAASLSPTQGDERTPYNFSINYSNPANIAPSSIAVVIDGTSLLLNSETTNIDWRNGTQFSIETLLGVGNHSYHFEALEDGRSHRIPQVGELQLEVSRYDSPPWLNHSSVLVDGVELFNDSSVMGDEEIINATRPRFLIGKEVEVRITFYDAEGDAAVENSVIAWIDGVPNLMERFDGNNSTEGQVWRLKTTTLSIGDNHTLYFTATSAYIASGSFEAEKLRFPLAENMSIPLPAIEEPPPPNVPPLLRTPGDGRLMLNPFAGAESDNYTFLIEVVDTDWTADRELEIWLVIDGVNHSLQPVNLTDHRNGTIFGITLRLEVGEHQHRFGVSDGEDEAEYPATGMVNGPTVQANMIPVEELALRPIFVQWAWWMVLANLLLILGGAGWATMTLREARRVVFQREVRKMARAFREFDEQVDPEERAMQEETPADVWRTRPSETYYTSGYIESTVDEELLLAELGGIPKREARQDRGLQELLDDLQIDDSF